MQKALKGILALAGRVLFIGFSIQIVLGLVWMVCNFTGYQQFGETLLYEKIGQTLICDEYEGILYPVLIVMAKGMEGLFLIPYRCFLYLLQLGFAFFSAYTLLQGVGIRGSFRCIWGSLALLTFPMAMQCHLAVLPDSSVSSLLLLEIAIAVKVFRSGERLSFGAFARALACFAAMALLLPDFLPVGALPVLFLFLYGVVSALKEDKKRIFSYVVLLFAFAGILGGVNTLTRVEGYYGRTHKSVQAAIVSRCAWLYIGYNYESLPEEVRDCLTVGDALRVTCYAGNVEQVLGRSLEAAVGVERTKELFLELAGLAWGNEKKTILHSTAWDVVGYTFSPMVVQRQFDGKAYDSYTGRNYDIMREKTPQLTKYYMDYGCWWFATGLVVTAVVRLVSAVRYAAQRLLRKSDVGSRAGAGGRADTGDKAGAVWCVVLCLSTAGTLIMIYALRGAGMMDYKKSVAVTLLWMLWMLIICHKGMAEEKED